MRYKANPSFFKLGRINHHQGLDRAIYNALIDGETLEFDPPEKLIKGRYLKLVKDKKADDSSSAKNEEK